MILAMVLAAVSLNGQAAATHREIALAGMGALRSALANGARDREIRSIRHRFPCIDVADVRVGPVEIDGKSAAVSLDVMAQEAGFPSHWLVRLRRGQSGWRAVRFDVQESLLADRIAAAAGLDAGRRLLAENPALVTPELSRRLSERSDEIEERSDGRHAEEVAQLALEVAEDWDDVAGQARALWAAGRATNLLDRLDVAIRDYSEGYALAARVNDTALMAANLVGLGTEYLRKGELNRTKELEEGLRLARLAHDDRIAWMATHRLANVDRVAGRYDAAIRKYEEAVILAARAGDASGQAAATSDIGITYDYMNSRALAYIYIRRGVALYRRTANTIGLIRNIRNMADMEAWDERYADAEKHLREVEALLRQHPNDRTSAFVAATRSTLAIARHDMAGAEKACEQARALASRTDLPDLVTNMTEQLAGVRVRQKRYGEAVSLAREAIERSRNGTPDFDIYWQAQLELGRALAGEGKLNEARAAFEDSIGAIEGTLAEVPQGRDDQQAFFADKVFPYYEMFRTFIADRPEEAIPWVERARARTLLEFLAAKKRHASSRSLTTEEQTQEAAIQRGIADLNIRISEERARSQRNDAQIEAIERDLAAKRLELSVFVRRLYEAHPDLAMARGEVPAASVAQIRRTIPADGAVLEYVCLPERCWVIVLTRDGPPRIDALQADRDALHRLILEFSAELAARGLGFRAKGRRLYDLLIAPADSVVRNKRILCIIPDVPMGNLPFQALIDRYGKYLMERSAVFYAPSAAFLVWRATHAPAPPANDAANLLAFGNPRIAAETTRAAHARTRSESLASLPEAEEEVRALEQMYGARATVRVGAAATEADFKKEAPHFRLLHLATHGMYDDSDPMYSHLVLARRAGDGEDGLLEAREVADLDLHADLVVLSACETGRGGERAGEGMIGLSWALLAAGSETAILTDFKVDSAASRDLMIAFHHRLLQQGGKRMSGRVAVEALRDAEIAALKSSRSHPFYWASFFAAGGW